MATQDSPINWLDKALDWGWQTVFAVVGAAVAGLFWLMRRLASQDDKIASLHLHLAENYAKKSDIATVNETITKLKTEVSADIKEVKDGQDRIIELLLSGRVGKR